MPQISGIHYSMPAGTILACAKNTPLPRTLLCDGSAVSRPISAGGTVDTYKELWDAIGTTFGVGNGSSTFNIPDTRGIFLRGAGSQTIGSISYSGSLGTKQNDQIQGHNHSLPNVAVSGTFHRSGPDNTIVSNSYATSSGGPTNDGSNGTPRTGIETRPANIGVNYCIAY